MDNKPTRQELDSAIDDYAMAFADLQEAAMAEGARFDYKTANKPVTKALAIVNGMLDKLGIKDE